ncbi:MAG TPA: FHA domain-containing protein [Streptosporangiaceae bacterium]|nr:FHA domain-containing protein [Streptosporangiaceae bacterium]
MDQAFLEFAAGGRPGLELDKARLTVGRAPANDVQLDDGTVSSQHAAIEWQPNGWTIRDLGSSNGTHVNGQRIDQPRSLNPGDTVRLGHTELVFKIAGTAFLPGAPALASGYLDATDEWTPPGSPARPAPAPAPGPPRRVADQPPPAVPIPPYGGQGGSPGRQAPANDPLGARRNGGFAQVRGVARNVQRQLTEQTRVLTFRVERYDPSGNRLAPVGVELRQYRSGGLNDGEEVEVVGSWKRGTLRAQKVINLTTQAEVLGPTAAAKACGVIFITVFFIIFLCIAGGIIFAVVFSG